MLLSYFMEYFVARKNLSASDLKGDLLALQGLRDAPELSQALLHRLAGCFARALTLIVRGGELVAEKGIGIGQDKRQGSAPVAKFTLAPCEPGPLRQVLADGRLYYGPCADPVLEAQLYPRIGAPRIATALLLPILSRGRVIAIVYGDFGDGPVTTAPIDFFAVLAGQAGLVLENAIYRRQLEKSGGPG
jgi:GAF domain-containing protein